MADDRAETAFLAYMEQLNGGAYKSWPANQVQDARQDFRAGWEAAIDACEAVANRGFGLA